MATEVRFPLSMTGALNDLPARCPVATAAPPLRAMRTALDLFPPIGGEASRVGALTPIAPDDFFRRYCADSESATAYATGMYRDRERWSNEA